MQAAETDALPARTKRKPHARKNKKPRRGLSCRRPIFATGHIRRGREELFSAPSPPALSRTPFARHCQAGNFSSRELVQDARTQGHWPATNRGRWFRCAPRRRLAAPKDKRTLECGCESRNFCRWSWAESFAARDVEYGAPARPAKERRGPLLISARPAGAGKAQKPSHRLGEGSGQ